MICTYIKRGLYKYFIVQHNEKRFPFLDPDPLLPAWAVRARDPPLTSQTESSFTPLASGNRRRRYQLPGLDYQSGDVGRESRGSVQIVLHFMTSVHYKQY